MARQRPLKADRAAAHTWDVECSECGVILSVHELWDLVERLSHHLAMHEFIAGAFELGPDGAVQVEE